MKGATCCDECVELLSLCHYCMSCTCYVHAWTFFNCLNWVFLMYQIPNITRLLQPRRKSKDQKKHARSIKRSGRVLYNS
jgi:hypothetical protein